MILLKHPVHCTLHMHVRSNQPPDEQSSLSSLSVSDPPEAEESLCSVKHFIQSHHIPEDDVLDITKTIYYSG